MVSLGVWRSKKTKAWVCVVSLRVWPSVHLRVLCVQAAKRPSATEQAGTVLQPTGPHVSGPSRPQAPPTLLCCNCCWCCDVCDVGGHLGPHRLCGLGIDPATHLTQQLTVLAHRLSSSSSSTAVQQHSSTQAGGDTAAAGVSAGWSHCCRGLPPLTPEHTESHSCKNVSEACKRQGVPHTVVQDLLGNMAVYV
jgi:hypothetical protein